MRIQASAAIRVRSKWRAAFAGACIAAALLAMPASASAFTDENDYACHQEDFTFNGAPLSQRAIFYPGRCNKISAAQFAQEPLWSYYQSKGFDRNFLLWAPITSRSDVGSRKWAGCTNPHAHGTICTGGEGFGFSPSDDFPGPLTVKTGPGDGFIALICGNFSQSGGRSGPIPTFSGTKYLDANANGQRDSGEGGLSGWTIQLRYNGAVVDTRTTDANGSYSFDLNANTLPIGAGQFSVTETQQSGYQQTGTPGPINVDFAVGAANYPGNDLGNYRLPTADAGGPYTTPEGTNKTLDGSGSTGSGLTYAWDLDNDGQYDDATGVSPSFTTVGGDGTFPIDLRVTSGEGFSATDTSSVTVTNVAPTVGAIDTTAPKPEGTAVTVNGVITDPGWLDPLTATINWGDATGTSALSGIVEHTRPDASLTYSNVSHAYGTDGTYTVTICAADDDTTNNCNTQNVTITNVAPTVGPIVTNGPKPENSAVTVSSGTITDPGWLDPLTATINWGDGTATAPLPGTVENVAPDATLTYAAISHTYGDDGTFTIKICAADDDTTNNCATKDVTITNVNPTATIDRSGATDVNGTPIIFAHTGQAIAFKGRSTDPGSDDLTLRWNWDDGGSPIDASALYLNNPAINPDPDPSAQINPRDVTNTTSHAFGQVCAYEGVGFTALDDDGGSASDAVTVVIQAPAHAHDKSAGFWVHEFQSPTGEEIDGVTLHCYLRIAAQLSRVFNEVRDASTFTSAISVLNDGPDTARDRFDRVVLANWLNFANGAFEYDEPRDTNGNGVPDTTFAAGMRNAETVRLNPASTTAQIDAQRKILQTFDS